MNFKILHIHIKNVYGDIRIYVCIKYAWFEAISIWFSVLNIIIFCLMNFIGILWV